MGRGNRTVRLQLILEPSLDQDPVALLSGRSCRYLEEPRKDRQTSEGKGRPVS